MDSTIACGGVSWSRISLTPMRLSSATSSSGITPPPHHGDVAAVLPAKQLQHPREHRHLGPGKDADAQDVDVLLDGRQSHFLGSAVQPGVDDVHAGASRRQRATILTPRSWPSNPTLAIMTRIGWVFGPSIPCFSHPEPARRTATWRDPADPLT